MPPRSGGTRSLDYYAAQRCIHCKHLRYADQRVGDPCKFCPCTLHVIPADQPKAPQA